MELGLGDSIEVEFYDPKKKNANRPRAISKPNQGLKERLEGLLSEENMSKVLSQAHWGAKPEVENPQAEMQGSSYVIQRVGDAMGGDL